MRARDLAALLVEADAEVAESAGNERGEEDAEREAESSADEGGDDAFVADHPPHLAGHPDRPEHAELAAKATQASLLEAAR
jgi:hypothetical protein